MSLPDIAWLVHETDNELLRYSMRSVAAYGQGTYRKAWIVGVMPEWVTGADLIEVAEPDPREKFASIRAKVEALVSHQGVAREVVVLNDDAIAVAPITWEAVHMGSTADYLAQEAGRGRTSRSNTWIRAVENTARWMAEQGHGDIDCYETHVPLRFRTHDLRKALAAYPADVSCDYPGFYPIAGCGAGARGENAKIGPDAEEFLDRLPRLPGWVSTNDRGFATGMVGGYIRGLHREPCTFEA
jgi:hypothetical protein